MRHDRAFPVRLFSQTVVGRHAPSVSENGKGHEVGQLLAPGGDYQWRRDGELHLFNPRTVHLLQKAVRTEDYASFEAYTQDIDLMNKECCKPARSVGV